MYAGASQRHAAILKSQVIKYRGVRRQAQTVQCLNVCMRPWLLSLTALLTPSKEFGEGGLVHRGQVDCLPEARNQLDRFAGSDQDLKINVSLAL